MFTAAAIAFYLALVPQPPAALKVGPVPEALRKEWKLSAFYKKHIDLQGFPLLSSEKVSDAALLEAAYLINQMLAGRDDIRKALIKNRVRFAVMAPTEMTTDIPEHSDLTPKDYWDKRARGLGATRARPAVSCGEENLLNLRGDRYPRENILVHEFSYAMHEMGLNSLDRQFDARLRECYDKAMKKGLWKDTYAATNHKEYWAEAVQAYFHCNNPPDRQHNDVTTRDKLAKYDPELFAIIDAAYKQNPWKYVRYDQRKK
jgi:alpha-glucosidase